ncbi:MAG: peptidoglycan D,D-transpeptidase FtsI family protein, partial [Alkaliphilus sp.]
NNNNNKTNECNCKKKRNAKLLFIGIVSTLLILVLIMRLYYIQIVKHDIYTTEINKQKSVNIPIGMARGMILDRNFIPLVNREEKTYALIFSQIFEKNEDNLAVVEKLSGHSRESLIKLLNKKTRIIELPVNKSIDPNDNESLNIMGLYFINRFKRYCENQLMSHVIGYIKNSDGDGVTGIEKKKNPQLSNANKNIMTIVFDGKTKPLLGMIKKQENTRNEIKHVRLTLDYKIQKISEKVMDKYNRDGSVVISNVHTGEILAMVSRPNFNPNTIYKHINSEGDELFNKSIQMTFPPGSVFKIVLIAEALENHGLSIENIFNCSGYVMVGNTKIRCSNSDLGGHGAISLMDAFAESCNSSFIQLGQVLGAENILNMALKLGLGRKHDIGLLEEESGNLPYGNEILGPAIGNISIGQGKISVTPMQINQMTQIIANSGVKKPLFVVKSIIDDNYDVIERTEREEEKTLSSFTSNQIQAMMREVMKSGTGKNKIGEIATKTAGKTGTAEEGLLNHAWFTGFYPASDPVYAITVLVQNGGSGGEIAVPIFREIIKEMIQFNQTANY